MHEGFWHCKSVTIVWRTSMIINVMRRCDSVFIQWDAVKVSLCSLVCAKRPERPCIILELFVVFTLVYEGFWHCKSATSFEDIYDLWSLMYCDAVTVSLFNETLWKCHYAVLCLHSAPSVLYSHWCMKGSDTARVPPVLRTFIYISDH